MKYDVIIIGAGAAGFAAMRDLLDKGYTVCMLEAATQPGGRIATIRDERFDMPLETGAEFIHGKLPLTRKLSKEAGIAHEAVEGNMIRVQNGKWKNDEHDSHWDDFMSKLHRLKNDKTILEFLNENFSEEEYKSLRKDVQHFAEGFNLADISKASILSIRSEWKNIEKKQFRVKGGYSQLIRYLVDRCLTKGAFIFYHTCVNKIEHGNKVVVHTDDKRKFEAGKVIVTASVGVLQSGAIQFDPPLTEHAIAIQGLGFGTVIKFLFQFKTNFWNDLSEDIGFILSDEEIPTWWTQLPSESNLLTGWLGGPKAGERVFEKEDHLLQQALQSLSSIFRLPVSMISEELAAHRIVHWQNTPYIKGGYSYDTLATGNAKKLLTGPVNKMIYFAGEAIGQGESQGTVESALQSGIDTAAMIIEEDNR